MPVFSCQLSCHNVCKDIRFWYLGKDWLIHSRAIFLLNNHLWCSVFLQIILYVLRFLYVFPSFLQVDVWLKISDNCYLPHSCEFGSLCHPFIQFCVTVQLKLWTRKELYVSKPLGFFSRLWMFMQSFHKLHKVSSCGGECGCPSTCQCGHVSVLNAVLLTLNPSYVTKNYEVSKFCSFLQPKFNFSVHCIIPIQQRATPSI
jgi:hypothetical protein